MSTGTGRLTVYFEAPFWVGIFERWEDGRLSAAKVTFGAEPKDYEVYAWILNHYSELNFGPAIPAAEKAPPKNPKRMQREIKRQLLQRGSGTKAQQALQSKREQVRQLGRAERRAEKEKEAERRFERKQQKKKEKHKGR